MNETERNLEQIGMITLDFTHYPGEDLYCDGTVEDTILEIVKHNPPEAYGKIIEDRAEWPILYHLSPLRENIVSWLPITDSMNVLEVGSGCGAITGALAKKAGSVTCIELSKKRSYINAYRHKECDNVTIKLGNFEQVEPTLPNDYDYILLIGVFEYGKCYISTETPYEDFMKIIKKHCKQGGKIVIAIENKLGMKYWAGCKEDHYGTYFSGIEDYPEGGGVRTFTRNGLEKILATNEINQYSFYYPYPDYKFMTSLYSDSYLPKVGELSNNLRNFDRERLLLFDEKNAFDTVIREELFPLYSNSYLLVIGEELETKYAKYSNDREEKFAIRTDIRVDQKGIPYVAKIPLTDKAKAHIKQIVKAYAMLQERYEGGTLQWNHCELVGEELLLEFLRGITLEELFDELIAKQDRDGFLALFEEYVKAIGYHSGSGMTNYDVVFGNIIIQDEAWHVIDYEWTFEEPIATSVVAYRAFYCYVLGSTKRNFIKEESILNILHITPEEAATIRQQESRFQKYVTGQRLSMAEIREKIGYQTISVTQDTNKNIVDTTSRIQVYEDRGTGFTEQHSYFVENTIQTSDEEETVEVHLTVSKEVTNLRLDPMMSSCVVTMEEILWNETCEKSIADKYTTNGIKMGENLYVFATEDPNIVVSLGRVQKQEKNQLVIRFKRVKLPLALALKFKKKHFL